MRYQLSSIYPVHVSKVKRRWTKTSLLILLQVSCLLHRKFKYFISSLISSLTTILTKLILFIISGLNLPNHLPNNFKKWVSIEMGLYMHMGYSSYYAILKLRNRRTDTVWHENKKNKHTFSALMRISLTGLTFKQATCLSHILNADRDA